MIKPCLSSSNSGLKCYKKLTSGFKRLDHDITRADYDITRAYYDITRADHDITRANHDITRADYDITKADYVHSPFFGNDYTKQLIFKTFWSYHKVE